MYFPDRERAFLVALALAALNDALDMVGYISQPLETIIDVVLAIGISLIIERIDVWAFLICILDVLYPIDLVPIWTLYIIYRYFRWRERFSSEGREGISIPVR